MNDDYASDVRSDGVQPVAVRIGQLIIIAMPIKLSYGFAPN
jgi:hypothetical protein